MIYLDSSVALAYLLGEERTPPLSLWRSPLISSRLLQFEVWTRVHARGLTDSHSQLVNLLLKRVSLLELVVPVLNRAFHPFPAPVRTLDALHLASAEFLRAQGKPVKIASYDDRLLGAALRMGFEIADV